MKPFLLSVSLLFIIGLFYGCSSNDEIDIKDRNILGYWESTEIFERRGGLLFTADGKVKWWELQPTFDTKSKKIDEVYSESLWGYFWFEDNGAVHMQKRPKDSAPNPDELYYKIVSLTSDCMVIRTFGGIMGTPLKDGYDRTYRKLLSH